MTRHLFILVPSFSPAGPIKGAVALANGLCSSREVTLVALKRGPGVDAPIDPRIRVCALAAVGGWRRRIESYKAMLERAGGRESVASISLCFSADMVNILCRRHAVTCASVRGNLLCNYRMDYGPPGIPLAVTHLTALRACDQVVTMSRAMAKQVAFYLGNAPAVIPNFVDEAALEPYRRRTANKGPLRFVYLASLSRRKQPLVLLQAAAALRERGVDVEIDVVGGGPLLQQVSQEVERLQLQNLVRIHDHVAVPQPLVARADALVLPSLSEGMPRAALEALYLGVPCVLRDVDGNRELIEPGVNGFLFNDDSALPEAMISVAKLSRQAAPDRTSLLPMNFRQREASSEYLRLVEHLQ
jgi:glycosyltransferase involved in cell wall biosynthesis